MAWHAMMGIDMGMGMGMVMAWYGMVGRPKEKGLGGGHHFSLGA